MKKFVIKKISLMLVIIGALNWGLTALNHNVVEMLSLYITASTSSAIKEPIIPPFPKPLLKEAARRNVPIIKEKILNQNLFIFLMIL